VPKREREEGGGPAGVSTVLGGGYFGAGRGAGGGGGGGEDGVEGENCDPVRENFPAQVSSVGDGCPRVPRMMAGLPDTLREKIDFSLNVIFVQLPRMGRNGFFG
jgi:hypothetical protein